MGCNPSRSTLGRISDSTSEYNRTYLKGLDKARRKQKNAARDRRKRPTYSQFSSTSKTYDQQSSLSKITIRLSTDGSMLEIEKFDVDLAQPDAVISEENYDGIQFSCDRSRQQEGLFSETGNYTQRRAKGTTSDPVRCDSAPLLHRIDSATVSEYNTRRPLRAANGKVLTCVPVGSDNKIRQTRRMTSCDSRDVVPPVEVCDFQTQTVCDKLTHSTTFTCGQNGATMKQRNDVLTGGVEECSNVTSTYSKVDRINVDACCTEPSNERIINIQHQQQTFKHQQSFNGNSKHSSNQPNVQDLGELALNRSNSSVEQGDVTKQLSHNFITTPRRSGSVQLANSPRTTSHRSASVQLANSPRTTSHRSASVQLANSPRTTSHRSASVQLANTPRTTSHRSGSVQLSHNPTSPRRSASVQLINSRTTSQSPGSTKPGAQSQHCTTIIKDTDEDFDCRKFIISNHADVHRPSDTNVTQCSRVGNSSNQPASESTTSSGKNGIHVCPKRTLDMANGNISEKERNLVNSYDGQSPYCCQKLCNDTSRDSNTRPEPGTTGRKPKLSFTGSSSNGQIHGADGRHLSNSVINNSDVVLNGVVGANHDSQHQRQIPIENASKCCIGLDHASPKHSQNVHSYSHKSIAQNDRDMIFSQTGCVCGIGAFIGHLGSGTVFNVDPFTPVTKETRGGCDEIFKQCPQSSYVNSGSLNDHQRTRLTSDGQVSKDDEEYEDACMCEFCNYHIRANITHLGQLFRCDYKHHVLDDDVEGMPCGNDDQDDDNDDDEDSISSGRGNTDRYSLCSDNERVGRMVSSMFEGGESANYVHSDDENYGDIDSSDDDARDVYIDAMETSYV